MLIKYGVKIQSLVNTKKWKALGLQFILFPALKNSLQKAERIFCRSGGREWEAWVIWTFKWKKVLEFLSPNSIVLCVVRCSVVYLLHCYHAHFAMVKETLAPVFSVPWLDFYFFGNLVKISLFLMESDFFMSFS